MQAGDARFRANDHQHSADLVAKEEPTIVYPSTANRSRPPQPARAAPPVPARLSPNRKTGTGSEYSRCLSWFFATSKLVAS